MLYVFFLADKQVKELRKLIAGTSHLPLENLSLVFQGNVLQDSIKGEDALVQFHEGGMRIVFKASFLWTETCISFLVMSRDMICLACVQLSIILQRKKKLSIGLTYVILELTQLPCQDCYLFLVYIIQSFRLTSDYTDEFFSQIHFKRVIHTRAHGFRIFVFSFLESSDLVHLVDLVCSENTD